MPLRAGRSRRTSVRQAPWYDFSRHASERLAESIRRLRLQVYRPSVEGLCLDTYEMAAVRLQA